MCMLCSQSYNDASDRCWAKEQKLRAHKYDFELWNLAKYYLPSGSYESAIDDYGYVYL